MCGIAGYLGRNEISQERISEAEALLKKRGPDFQDNKIIKIEDYGGIELVLIHTRLAIIDLDSRANQPFTINGYTIVFNGEIYNYIELKNELVKQGYEFKTFSDTEVLLTAFIHFGTDFTNKLEGMWSLAIWNTHDKTLFLSRDRFGEKPLYYLQCKHGLYFASEIKAIQALSGEKLEVDLEQLLRYTVLGYKSLYKKDRTFFKNVKEVPRAHNLLINMDLQVSKENYWHPVIKSQQISLSDAIDGAKHYLTESVRLRMRSDVPVAFCLSGGVDSAALVSIASKLLNIDATTFSIIDKDPRYNEKENIMHTVNDLGCNHYLIDIPEDNSVDRLKNLISYHDSPVSTISYFVHSLLSEKISSHGYKVAFSGTSADEIFTGYYDHFLLHLYQMYEKPEYGRCLDDWKEHIAGYVRNPSLSDPELYLKNPGFRDHVFDNASEFLTWLNPELCTEFDLSYSEETYCSSLLRNRMLNELFQEATPVILHEDDLNSMQYSVENRSPYLDSNLFDFIYSLPEEYLIRDGYGKYLLRESMRDVLNDNVRLDRKKKGFNASIHSVINFNDESIKDEFLNPGNEIFNFINFEKVAEITKQPVLPNHYSKFLFNLINSQIFIAQHS